MAARAMGFVRELRKAKSEVTAAVKAWKIDNPRRAGETLAQYRRRAQSALQAEFGTRYGDADWSSWLKIILEVLKMILPLLIASLLFAVLVSLPTLGQAAEVEWSTLDGATVVAAAPAVAVPAATTVCVTPRPAATCRSGAVGLVRGQPVRNVGRVLVAAKPIRRVGAAIVTAQPLRKAARAVAAVRPIRRVAKGLAAVVRSRPLARLAQHRH